MLKNAKLKTKIIGIVCMLLAVVCIGFGVASYRTSANAIEKRVNESLPQIAEDAGKLINARLAVYFVGIDTAANRLVIRSMDWSKQLPALKEEISRQGFMEMGVATPDGKTRYTDGTTADLGDRDYFKSALAGKVVMSDVVISRVTGKPVIMMAAPITVDGHAVGVLLARLDGQLLSEISDNVKFGDIGYSYIINAKGVLIAHRKREFVTDSRNFLEEGKTKPEFSAVSKMLQRMVKGEKGYDLYPFAGAENYFGFAPIPNTGWSVAVGALKSEVLEDVYEMKTTFALLSLGFLVAGALVAFALAQSILSRIISLQSQLAGIKTLTDERIKMNDSAADEIYFLANDINKMLSHIESNELFLHQTINALHAGVITISPKTHTILAVNDYAQKLIGLPKQEIIGKSCHNFICPNDAGSCPITDRHQSVNLSVRKLITGNKTIKPVLKSVHCIQRNGEEFLLETFIDISNVEKLEQKLKESAQKYKSLFMNTGVATVVVSNSGKICMANSKFATLVDREIYEIEDNLNVADFFIDAEKMFPAQLENYSHDYNVEFETKLLKQHKSPIDVHVSLARTAGSSTFIISVFDTSERVQMELDLEYRATHDLLTGFFNKAFYKEQLSQTIARAHAEDGAIAVLLMDLDRFKQVNDSFGHPAGDRLLQNVAERLLHMVGSDQLIARTGGDEFVFILEGENAAAQAERLAKNILSSATQCFTVDNSQIYITASIGISLYPGDGLTADMLIKNADLAMYRSKERGKNTYTFFTKELDDAVNAKFELETELFAAIEDENFEVFYQPKVDATTNSIVGCEALVRWKLPDGRYVSPADFISLAEETGLIVGIDRIVLQTVCKDLNDFSALFTTPPPVAVNISARSIAQENFVEDFLATVDGYKVAHEMIGVEITETVLMTDLEVSINSISRLDKQGFRIFLDDFGTGYSSLSYLHSMPISCLKIDKRFVDEIFSQQNKSDKIVTTIINLASSLDVDVIAEGVETKEQLGFLVKNKCNIIQGYLYSKPLPKDDYIKFCLNFSKPVAAEVQ